MMTAHHRALVVWLGLLASHVAESSPMDPVNATGHRAFADALAKNLYAKPNECSSALGVSMAFSLIYPGCTGKAVDQLRGVLGYPAGSNLRLVWKDATDRMLREYGGQCKGRVRKGVCNWEAPTLKIANAVWFDDGRDLDPNYASVVGGFAKRIDLGGNDYPRIVNEWVKNSTDGSIESILAGPLHPPPVLIAINSIYLKASWKYPFKEEKTKLGSFYGTATRDGKVSEARFMNRVFRGLPYSHDALPGHQVVQLPFDSSEMSMVLVLPSADGAGPVASADLLPALGGLQTTRVALSMPKFKFESTYDDELISTIRQTGITAPFGGWSLCGIFRSGHDCGMLRVGKVIQKNAIYVNEAGVEAAAATAALVWSSGWNSAWDPPVAMVCDHPFQFFIHDGAEDLVLFEGRVGAPAIPDDPVEPSSNSVPVDALGYPVTGPDPEAAPDDAPSSEVFSSVDTLGSPVDGADPDAAPDDASYTVPVDTNPNPNPIFSARRGWGEFAKKLRARFSLIGSKTGKGV